MLFEMALSLVLKGCLAVLGTRDCHVPNREDTG